MSKHRGALLLQMSQAAGRTTACTRRVTARCPTAFGLTYAGLEENGEVTIGDGAVVNLSPRVVWSQGRRFGVGVTTLNVPEGRRLRDFLLTCSSR